MTFTSYLDAASLDAGLDHILESPKDLGTVELIVRRPGVDEREEVDQGELDLAEGLIGDDLELTGDHQHSRRVPEL